MTESKQRVLFVSHLDVLDPSLISTFQADGIEVTVVYSTIMARRDLEAHGLPLGMIVNLNQLEDDGVAFCDEMTMYAGLPVMVIGPAQPDQSLVLDSLEVGDTFVRGWEADAKSLIVRLKRLWSRLASFSYAVGRDVGLLADVSIDFIGKTIQIAGKTIALTPTEIALLHVLIVHSDEVVDAEVLIERVWRGAVEGNPNALRVHMHRLRRKLGWKRGQEGLIRTARGTGYTLVTK